MTKNRLRPQRKPAAHKGRKIPALALSVDDYIRDVAAAMTSARLKELALFSHTLAGKLSSSQAVSRFEFQQQGLLLIKILLSKEVRVSRDPLPEYLAEVGVAAHYLLKGADLIPDHVPEIGLADDEIILRKVFSRNPELNQIFKSQ